VVVFCLHFSVTGSHQVLLCALDFWPACKRIKSRWTYGSGTFLLAVVKPCNCHLLWLQFTFSCQRPSRPTLELDSLLQSKADWTLTAFCWVNTVDIAHPYLTHYPCKMSMEVVPSFPCFAFPSTPQYSNNQIFPYASSAPLYANPNLKRCHEEGSDERGQKRARLSVAYPSDRSAVLQHNFCDSAKRQKVSAGFESPPMPPHLTYNVAEPRKRPVSSFAPVADTIVQSKRSCVAAGAPSYNPEIELPHISGLYVERAFTPAFRPEYSCMSIVPYKSVEQFLEEQNCGWSKVICVVVPKLSVQLVLSRYLLRMHCSWMFYPTQREKFLTLSNKQSPSSNICQHVCWAKSMSGRQAIYEYW